MKITLFTFLFFTSLLTHAREVVDTFYTISKEHDLTPRKTYMDKDGNMFRDLFFGWTYEVDEDIVYQPIDKKCLYDICKSTYIIVEDPKNDNGFSVHRANAFYPNNEILVDKNKIINEEPDSVLLDNVIYFEVPENKVCKTYCVNDFVWRGEKNHKDLEFYKYLTSDFDPKKFNLRPPFDPNLGQVVAKLNNGYYLFAFKPDQNEQSIEFVINIKDSFILVK
ncbi:MAG: hypothetical protein MK008_10035 [Bdellovibrionales bacterium]|nr:hypothetical protein [Bdellovibrionales bacterium]